MTSARAIAAAGHGARSVAPVLLSLLLVGCEDAGVDESPDAGPPRIVDDTRRLVPGDIIEGEWEAGPDDRIQIAIEGTSRFGWNIHGHDGDETTTIVEQLDMMEVSHDFAPPAQATWNLLVANRTAGTVCLTIHMELHGDAQWTGWDY